VVAIVSHRERDADALFDLVRQSYCYRNLTRDMFAGVLSMLAGRYADESLRELRARISWDRVNNLLRPLPGSSRLAITGGGTIADAARSASISRTARRGWGKWTRNSSTRRAWATRSSWAPASGGLRRWTTIDSWSPPPRAASQDAVLAGRGDLSLHRAGARRVAFPR